MSYAFKRSSEVFLVADGVGYSIPTLSEFSLSQTISEKTLNRRNQFSSIAPKRVINRMKNVGNGSIEFYYSLSCKALPTILASLGFQNTYTRKFEFHNEYSTRPTPIYIIIKDKLDGRVTVIPKAYVTNVDIGASPLGMNSIVVGFEYADTLDVLEDNVILQQGKDPVYPKPSYIDFAIDTFQVNSVKTAAFTITRDLSWLSTGANQFNLGQVAGARNPVVTNYNISATATANDNLPDDVVRYMLPNNQDIRIGNNALYMVLRKARITTRKSPDSVFTVSFDIKHQSLLPVVLGGTYDYQY